MCVLSVLFVSIVFLFFWTGPGAGTGPVVVFPPFHLFGGDAVSRHFVTQ